MEIFYSALENGFFFPDIHGELMPTDAKQITAEQYEDALAAPNLGKMVAPGADGLPALVDPPAPAAEQVQTAKVALVQEHMDRAARALRYDSIANAITYAEEPAVPKFQAEGRAFRAWRSLVWAKCYEILDQVLAGDRQVPSDEELVAQLPALVLPATT